MTNVEYLKKTSRKALKGLIDLWISMEDSVHGGFGTIDAFGRRDFTSDRSSVIQTRTLYGLSAACRAMPDPRCEAAAKRQFDHIRNFWIDSESGGVWSGLDCHGTVLAEEKAVYENAFAIYGLTEYYLAFRDEAALEMAKTIYRGLENARLAANTDTGIPPEWLGYADCYSRKWERTVPRTYGRQRSEAGEYGLDNQSHIMEAYTNLYRAWPDAGLRERLAELTRLVCSDTFCPDGKRVSPRYDTAWRPVSRDETFGDSMEVAWLLAEQAECVGDPQLQHMGMQTALTMMDNTLERGLDRENGGFFEGVRGDKLSTRKMWWCHCEAINACLNGFSLTNKEMYLEYAAQLWRFYEAYLIAPEGYWRGVVQQDGTPMVPDGPKAMPICAYHSIRVCVKTMEALYDKNETSW